MIYFVGAFIAACAVFMLIHGFVAGAVLCLFLLAALAFVTEF